MTKGAALFDHAIILAGGAGNRLWPTSTNERPKYLLEIAPDTSLLRATLTRAAAVSRSVIVVVTHHRHAPSVIEQIGSDGRWGLKGGQRVVVLLEPQAQNTGPALALATSYLNAHCGGGTAICMPADHIIEPLAVFADDAARALVLARKQYITLFGIKPQQVNTGYGHLEVGASLGDESYEIDKFHEKPDHATAERYVQAGGFYWNSGLFAFDTAHMWGEYGVYEPQIADVLRADGADGGDGADGADGGEGLFSFEARSSVLLVQRLTAGLRAAYRKLPFISIDHAIGERSQRVAMAVAHFGWNDVGSWDEIARLIDQRQMSNPKHGVAPLTHNAANNTVISDYPVALCGVDDIIVVVEDGVVMVCKKGQSQDVKKLALQHGARVSAAAASDGSSTEPKGAGPGSGQE